MLFYVYDLCSMKLCMTDNVWKSALHCFGLHKLAAFFFFLFFSFLSLFCFFFLTGEDIVLKCLGFNSRLFVDQKLDICFTYLEF